MNRLSSDLLPVTPLQEAVHETANNADDILAQMAQNLFELFERVQAQQPERGVNTLLHRAQNLSKAENITLSLALETIYQGALKRTEARLALTQSCSGFKRNMSQRCESKPVHQKRPYLENQPKSLL